MPSGKTVKLVLFEALQFLAIAAPVFVVMERFAGLMHELNGGQDRTAYWLVVAASVAYVTSATLLVWVPLKVLILRRCRFMSRIKHWRPAALAYVILCPLPCFAILIAASKLQVDRGERIDTFSELPVSLVLLWLICVDVIERLRTCSLTGKAGSSRLDSDFDMWGPVLTHLDHVTTVTGQLPPHPPHPPHHHPPHQHQHHGDDSISISQNRPPSPTHTDTTSITTTTPAAAAITNGTPAARRYLPDDRHRQPTHTPAYLCSSSTPHSGPLGPLWSRDDRPLAFVDSFLFWLDTAEMLRAAADPDVFYSAWAIPVFTLAFLSALRLAMAPGSPLVSCVGVALQDFPFLALRVALQAVFGGRVTPALYAAKNLLVCLSYAYFTFLTGVFKRRSMF
ncbi:hypothetical protein NHX12_004888 [Muraenolepis orangiensis]|uniref:Transmembrane protein 236 n=1 Tax=Muraenolepis orangiensis TaxID=630683 RepID=A0A9Q0IER8_9TELE|nr:hypothetical protein NHX12_004888 [Muraenolepis orangiensis]